jgi:hypothetical protein
MWLESRVSLMFAALTTTGTDVTPRLRIRMRPRRLRSTISARRSRYHRRMDARVPMYKGIGFLPVVSALNGHARGPRAVPAELKHYLDDGVVITQWYPERDFIALCQCLADVLEADGMPNVWSYFGTVAAERDLKGAQDRIPAERRVRLAGAYRLFTANEVVSVTIWMQRLRQLWPLYHDTGHMVVGRIKGGACEAVLRLCGYPAPLPSNYVLLHTVYFSEYARFLNLNASLRFAQTTPGVAPISEWQLICEDGPELRRELEALPLLTPLPLPRR